MKNMMQIYNQECYLPNKKAIRYDIFILFCKKTSLYKIHKQEKGA